MDIILVPVNLLHHLRISWDSELQVLEDKDGMVHLSRETYLLRRQLINNSSSHRHKIGGKDNQPRQLSHLHKRQLLQTMQRHRRHRLTHLGRRPSSNKET